MTLIRDLTEKLLRVRHRPERQKNTNRQQLAEHNGAKAGQAGQAAGI